jgi:glutathione S-transferase
MHLYVDPISTKCLPVLLFAAEHGHPLQITAMHLSKGDHLGPQYGLLNLLPDYAFSNPTTQADFLRRAEQRAPKWFAILDTHWLSNSQFLCGPELTIADYLGSCYVAISDLVGFDLTPYPNVRRWMSTMEARPSRSEARREWNEFRASLLAQRAAARGGGSLRASGT